MKRLIVVVLFSSLLVAQSFLVKKPPVKRQAPHQLRQQITEAMGSLLEQHAYLLEQTARISQTLCKEIKMSLEGSYKNGSVKELKDLLQVLEAEQLRLRDQKISQDRFLKRLK